MSHFSRSCLSNFKIPGLVVIVILLSTTFFFHKYIALYFLPHYLLTQNITSCFYLFLNYMYICIYVSICVCVVCVCVVCMCVCRYRSEVHEPFLQISCILCVCMHVHMCGICVYIWCVCMFMHVMWCVCVHTCACVCVWCGVCVCVVCVCVSVLRWVPIAWLSHGGPSTTETWWSNSCGQALKPQRLNWLHHLSNL